MSSISELAAPTQRLSVSALIMTSIYTLGVNAVWLSYNIFILPVQVQSVTSESTKGIALGALVGVAISGESQICRRFSGSHSRLECVDFRPRSDVFGAHAGGSNG